MNRIVEILRQLEEGRFWGKLEIEMRDGEFAVLRKSETLKILSPRMEKTRDGQQLQTAR